MSMSHNIVGWERKLGSWRGVTDIIFFTLKMLLFAFLHLIINKLSDDKWNDLLRQPWWIEGSLLKDRWATRNAYCFRLAENWRGGDQGQWEWINIKSITELTSGKRLEHEGKTMILDSNLFFWNQLTILKWQAWQASLWTSIFSATKGSCSYLLFGEGWKTVGVW